MKVENRIFFITSIILLLLIPPGIGMESLKHKEWTLGSPLLIFDTQIAESSLFYSEKH